MKLELQREMTRQKLEPAGQDRGRWGAECRELMVPAKLKGLPGTPSGEALLHGKQREALFIFFCV